MNAYSKSYLLHGASLAFGLSAFVHPAFGQDQSAAGETAAEDAPGEIIVTANKREERLNDVGLTITAISGDALAERKITSLAEISSAVPGLTFAQSSSNTPILTLRGVGFNSATLGAYPAVSVYVDQVPLPFPVLASHAAYDLERIEVLKGPQGTLFGQNSTGGAINFIAAKPTASTEAGVDVSYGRFNEVEGNFYLSGSLSDSVRARIAGTALNSDGWQISDTRPNDRNGAKSYVAGRFLLDWDASERIRFSLNVNGWIDKGEPQASQFVLFSGQIPAGVRPIHLDAQFTKETPRSADWSTGIWTPRGDRKLYQAALRSDIDLSDSLTLTSITSYVDFKQNQTQDFDGLPIFVTDFMERGTIKSFNQEIRIGNDPSSTFRWVLGGNYENSKTFNFQQETFENNTTAFVVGIDSSFQYVDQRIENYAAFGNVELDLTSQLVAKAGIRYTKSDNDALLCVGDGGNGKIVGLFNFLGTLSGNPFTPVTIAPPNNCASLNALGVPNGPATPLTLSEDNVSWRVGLDYKISPGTLLYANVSRGYKAGSFPLIPASDTLQFKPVTQESVTAYEAGIKTDLFDRRVHVNAAAFYYNYKDKQVLGRIVVPIFGPNNSLVNVPKSRIFGLETDISIRVIDGLTLTGSVTYLSSNIQEYTGFDSPGVFRDLSGNDLPFAPKFSYGFDADYRHEIAGGGTPFIGFSVTGRSTQDTVIDGDSIIIPNGPSSRVLPGLVHPYRTNPFATVDGRIGYEAADGAWKVMIFGKNIFNKYYWSNVVDQSEVAQRYAGMPATYGVTVGVKFK